MLSILQGFIKHPLIINLSSSKTQQIQSNLHSHTQIAHFKNNLISIVNPIIYNTQKNSSMDGPPIDEVHQKDDRDTHALVGG